MIKFILKSYPKSLRFPTLVYSTNRRTGCFSNSKSHVLQYQKINDTTNNHINNVYVQERNEYRLRDEMFSLIKIKRQSWINTPNYSSIKQSIRNYKSFPVIRDVSLNLIRQKIYDEGIWKDIMLCILDNQLHLKAIQLKYLSNILASLSKLSIRESQCNSDFYDLYDQTTKLLVNTIGNICQTNINISTDDLSEIILCLGKLKISNKHILNAVINLLMNDNISLNPIQYSNIMLGLSKLYVIYQYKLDGSDEENQKIIVNYINSKEFDKNIKYLHNQLNDLNYFNTVSSLFAFHSKNTKVLKKITEVSLELLPKLDNQKFSHLVNSISQSDPELVPLGELIKSEFIKRIDTLKIEEYAGIIKGLVHSNLIDCTSLIIDTKDYIFKHLNEFKPNEIAILTYCMAQLTIVDETLYSKLVMQIKENLNLYNIQSICQIFWSLNVLNKLNYDVELTKKIIQKIINTNFDKMKGFSLFQAYQGLIHFLLEEDINKFDELDILNIKGKIEYLEKLLLPVMIKRHQNYKIKSDINPETSIDLVNILKKLKFNAIPEFVLIPYTIDIAIVDLNDDIFLHIDDYIKKYSESNKDMRSIIDHDIQILKIEDFKKLYKKKDDIIFIEINVINHYIQNTNKLKGSTLLKTRYLKKLGYKVLSLSSSDMYTIGSRDNPINSCKYLVQLIKNAYKNDQKPII